MLNCLFIYSSIYYTLYLYFYFKTRKEYHHIQHCDSRWIKILAMYEMVVKAFVCETGLSSMNNIRFTLCCVLKILFREPFYFHWMYHNIMYGCRHTVHTFKKEIWSKGLNFAFCEHYETIVILIHDAICKMLTMV